MTIFVEGSSVLRQRTGIGQFTVRLLESYNKNYSNNVIDIFGFKFFTQGPPEYPVKAKQNFKYSVNKWLPGRVYNQLYKYNLALPVDALLGVKKSDVFIFPNFVHFPLIYNHRSLLMIHDLSFVYFSQFAHPKDLPYKLKYVPKSIKKATRIITISENSKKEIIEHYGVDKDKISIVHPAVDTGFFNKKSEDEIKIVKERYALPNKYILYTGTIEPRKNINGLLEAYKNINNDLSDEYGLVLAGGKGWQDDGIIDQIEKLKNEGLKIIQTGYVPDEDLPAIYSGASVFVFPSYYEGFGIPPLEAMACGVPVISSNNSSLPEAIGKAGILINPYEPNEISNAIEKLLEDKYSREELINEGYKQVKMYTWEKAADELQDAIIKLN